MKKLHCACAAILASFALSPAGAWASGLPVFDAANYAQNLLAAARALDQVNNQIASLQNEAAMLRNMEKNLRQADFPELKQMSSAIGRIDRLIGKAEGIRFRVQGLDEQVRSLFPGELGKALTGDQRVASARARLDAATSAYRQAIRVEAGIAENVTEDMGVLEALSATSQRSEGALEAAQATNQLLALSVKQQLQLQDLDASEYRQAAIERARRAQAEEDGRAATRRFLLGAAAAD